MHSDKVFMPLATVTKPAGSSAWVRTVTTKGGTGRPCQHCLPQGTEIALTHREGIHFQNSLETQSGPCSSSHPKKGPLDSSAKWHKRTCLFTLTPTQAAEQG